MPDENDSPETTPPFLLPWDELEFLIHIMGKTFSEDIATIALAELRAMPRPPEREGSWEDEPQLSLVEARAIFSKRCREVSRRLNEQECQQQAAQRAQQPRPRVGESAASSCSPQREGGPVPLPDARGQREQELAREHQQVRVVPPAPGAVSAQATKMQPMATMLPDQSETRNTVQMSLEEAAKGQQTGSASGGGLSSDGASPHTPAASAGPPSGYCADQPGQFSQPVQSAQPPQSDQPRPPDSNEQAFLAVMRDTIRDIIVLPHEINARVNGELAQTAAHLHKIYQQGGTDKFWLWYDLAARSRPYLKYWKQMIDPSLCIMPEPVPAHPEAAVRPSVAAVELVASEVTPMKEVDPEEKVATTQPVEKSVPAQASSAVALPEPPSTADPVQAALSGVELPAGKLGRQDAHAAKLDRHDAPAAQEGLPHDGQEPQALLDQGQDAPQTPSEAAASKAPSEPIALATEQAMSDGEESLESEEVSDYEEEPLESEEVSVPEMPPDIQEAFAQLTPVDDEPEEWEEPEPQEGQFEPIFTLSAERRLHYIEKMGRTFGEEAVRQAIKELEQEAAHLIAQEPTLVRPPLSLTMESQLLARRASAVMRRLAEQQNVGPYEQEEAAEPREAEARVIAAGAAEATPAGKAQGAPAGKPQENVNLIPTKRSDGWACPSLPVGAYQPSVLTSEVSPWLEEYVTFLRKWSPRAYEGYYLMIALAVLSTVAARRVVLHYGGAQYTPLTGLLVGKTSAYTKTTTLKHFQGVLAAAGLGWLFGSNMTTPEKLLSDMAGRAVPENYHELSARDQQEVKNRLALCGQVGWSYDEFGMHLDDMAKDGGTMSAFKGLLRIMDDCPTDFEYSTRGNGTERIVSPYLCLLGSLTVADIKPYADRSHRFWKDGFFARIAMACPPADHPPKRDPRPLGQMVYAPTLTEPLQRWHERLGMPEIEIITRSGMGKKDVSHYVVRHSELPEVPVTLGVGVEDACNAYDNAMADLRDSGAIPEALCGNYARFSSMALRVAMLLASHGGGDVITLDHWRWAQHYAEQRRTELHSLLTQANAADDEKRSEAAQLEDRVVHVLESRAEKGQEWMSANDIRRYVHGDSTDRIEKVINSLVRAGSLKRTVVKGSVKYGLNKE